MTDHQYPNPTHVDNSLLQQLDVDFALRAAGLGIWEVDPFTNQVIWDERYRQLFQNLLRAQVSPGRPGQCPDHPFHSHR